MDTDNFEDLNVLTEKIIGCAMKVSNTLGVGFLEKVYENALGIELRRSGLAVEQQKSLRVIYDGIVVGEFFADIVVNNRILLELKGTRAIDDAHQAQVLNYLKATDLRVGLLLNFGTMRLGVKRFVL